MPVGARPPRRRRFLAFAVGLLLTLVVGESICRIDALFPGDGYDSDRMRGFLLEHSRSSNFGDQLAYVPRDDGVDLRQHRNVLDPWSGWTTPWLLEQTAMGRDIFRARPNRKAFDVLLLGGSFAAQFGNESNARLRTRIAEHLGVEGPPVLLWNFAVAAQKQPSQLHRLTALLAEGWQPDLVLCVDGYNELALSAENAASGADPVYPILGFWGPLARAGDADPQYLDLLLDVRGAQHRTAGRADLGLRFGLWRSAFTSRLLSGWISIADRELRAARERSSAWKDDATRKDTVLGPIPHRGAGALAALDPPGMYEGAEAWIESARNLRAICDRRGVPLVHIVQPGLDDAGSKPATEEELRTNRMAGPWLRAIQNGYPLLRERIERLAREGIVVVDGTRVFEGNTETLYTDGCHLNPRGYELFAQFVLDRIREVVVAHGTRHAEAR